MIAREHLVAAVARIIDPCAFTPHREDYLGRNERRRRYATNKAELIADAVEQLSHHTPKGQP
jgi:hypothetical protein